MDIIPTRTFIPSLLTAMLAGSIAAPSLAADPQTAMNSAACTTCHALDKKMLGPAFKDVAAKYKGQDVNQQLFDKVRKGGKGSFGKVPMPPNGKAAISDDDLKEVIKFILKQ